MAMSNDYIVGKGKPPTATQFKKGESGNSRGRPKGVKNFKTDLLEEMGERIVIREGGRSRTISKQRAFIKTVFSRALHRDARAANTLMDMSFRLLDVEGAPLVVAPPLDASERTVLEVLKIRLLGNAESEEKPDHNPHATKEKVK